MTPQRISVTLHLEPADADDVLGDYTAEWKLRLVKKYYDFIAWPIRTAVGRRIQAM
jgi:molecular chaperone HtpG